MKNKKAILVENVLSLLIAAVGIALLIFGAVKLYKITVSQEEENAKTLINILEGKINTLQDGEIGKFPIQGIEKWFLTGWSKGVEDRPNKCFFESCICVCKGDGNYKKDNCQKEGFCRDVKKDTINIVGDLTPEETEVNVVPGTAAGQIRTRPSRIENFISLPSNLIEIEITKTSSELIIKKNG